MFRLCSKQFVVQQCTDVNEFVFEASFHKQEICIIHCMLDVELDVHYSPIFQHGTMDALLTKTKLFQFWCRFSNDHFQI